jgi:hypothetical protein
MTAKQVERIDQASEEVKRKLTQSNEPNKKGKTEQRESSVEK